MHKLEKKCRNCKFCKCKDGNWVCYSTLSSMYMENIYPDDETCELIWLKSKTKKKRNYLDSSI